MSECISCAGIFTLIWDLLEQRSISFLQLKKKNEQKARKIRGKSRAEAGAVCLDEDITDNLKPFRHLPAPVTACSVHWKNTEPGAGAEGFQG